MAVLREMLLGTAAGAVGTIAFDAATYADLALRARPSSSVPAEVDGRLAEKAGVDLGSDETEQNCKCVEAALSGYGGSTAGSRTSFPHLADSLMTAVACDDSNGL